MTEADHLSLGLLVLRVAIAVVFLNAAWRCTSTRAAFKQIQEETALMYPFLEPDLRHRLGDISAYIGMAMMYGGGISVLLGLEPRLGGLTLSVFSLLGLQIHRARRAMTVEPMMSGNMYAAMAFAGLSASGMKNLVIIATGFLFFLIGAGKYSLGIDCTGKLLGLGN
jgi:uncharacterized membrane protein YphA (DoxX/SURF4 family)